MNIAILQSASLGVKNNNIDNYLKEAIKNSANLVLLPEYSLNSFFKELESMPLSMIKEQSIHYINYLKERSKHYKAVIIAPLVVVKNKKCYKVIAKFSPKSVSYYKQQILMPYAHWNEERFFDNEKSSIKSPMIFRYGDIKFAILAGFELHFDEMFSFLREKRVEVLLTSTSSTFNSDTRWEELIKMRAFLNGIYIIRANRVGQYDDKNEKWKFYGDSAVVDPFGEVVDKLGNKEELAIFNVDKSVIKEANTTWKFKQIMGGRK